MDIEISPGARGQLAGPAARDLDGFRLRESGIGDKRLCSMDHPAAVHGERAGRTFGERTMGVLWRHSSVNLVEAAVHRTGRAGFLRRVPEIAAAVSIPESPPQPAQQPYPAP
jgi:hypothetical protein